MATKLPARRFLLSLEKAKEASVGQLLFKAARLFNEQAIAIVQAHGGTGVRVAHTALFPHIAWEGTRSTELAQRVGISKQAIGQLLGELEEMGIVQREPDPSDRRASLVRFTEHGQRALIHGLGVLKELEKQIRHKVGATTMRELKTGLIALVSALEEKG